MPAAICEHACRQELAALGTYANLHFAAQKRLNPAPRQSLAEIGGQAVKDWAAKL